MARPNAAEFRRFAQYVLDRAVDLHLRDWDIAVKMGETDDGMNADSLASVDVNPGRRSACVLFSDLYWDLPADEKRHVVAHELIHIHQWDVLKPVDDAEDILGTMATRLLMDSMRLANERACDALAKTVSAHFPAVP